MTRLFDIDSARSETSFPTTIEAVVLRMTGFGLLALGVTAAAVGVSVLMGRVVSNAAGTLAVSALLPFLS